MSQKLLRVTSVGTSPHAMGGVAQVVAHQTTLSLPNIQWTHVITHQDGPLIMKLTRFFLGLAHVFLKLPRTDLLYVHCSGHGSAKRKLWVMRLARLFKTPYIIHAHDGHFENFYNTLSHRKKQQITHAFLRAKAVIVIAECGKIFYHKSLGVPRHQLHTLRHCVRVVDTVPTSPSTVSSIVYLGLIDESKGAFDLIKALGKLHKTSSDRVFKAILAGNGKLKEARVLTHSLGLDEHVEFPGWVDDTAPLLAGATLYCLPSYAEAGVPFSVAEAMSQGVPVVSTRLPGIQEIITHGKNGLLVEPGDSDGLAQQITDLLDNQAKRDMLRKAAQHTAQEHFSQTHYTAQLVRILTG